MHVLARGGACDLDALLAVLVRAVRADDVGPVEAERDVVRAARHGGERVLADPVVGVPEGDEGVAAADGEVGSVWAVGGAVGGAGVGV